MWAWRQVQIKIPLTVIKKCGRGAKFKNSKLTVKNGAKSLFTFVLIAALFYYEEN